MPNETNEKPRYRMNIAIHWLSGGSTRMNGATAADNEPEKKKHMSRAAIVANCQTIPFIAPRNIAYIRMPRVRRSYHMSGFLPWLKEESEIRSRDWLL